ncbi:MAG: formate dehydrogenase accessory sulfurtransferase FdhD [Tepidisphaerales bacterium]
MNCQGPVSSATVIRCNAGRREAAPDHVAVEEPLEIRLGKNRLAVLMRTPGHDVDLATGFLLTEGLVPHPDDIAGIDYCPNVSDSELGNVLVVLPEAGRVIVPPQRAFYASASCGICGKTGIESVALAAPPASTATKFDLATLISLPERLRQCQTVFDQTGGLHAAGLYAPDGQSLCVREDIGRHNAVDKVIGALAADGRFPLPDVALLVSGRASFEICQKAAMAGIPLVASISAPSSLAIELARRLGMTLVGFLRGDGCNIYCGEQRLR